MSLSIFSMKLFVRSGRVSVSCLGGFLAMANMRPDMTVSIAALEYLPLLCNIGTVSGLGLIS